MRQSPSSEKGSRTADGVLLKDTGVNPLHSGTLFCSPQKERDEVPPQGGTVATLGSQLPVPVRNQLVESRQMIDLQIASLDGGAAGFSRRYVSDSHEAQKGWNAAVYFNRGVPDLAQLTRLLPEFTLLFRAVPKDTGTFKEMLRQAQLRKQAIQPYAEFLASVSEWAVPTGSKPFGRELVLWAPWLNIRRHLDKQRRFAEGHLVSYHESGNFVRATLNRSQYGRNNADLSSMTYTGTLQPELIAAPLAIRWRMSDVLLGSKALGFWTGVIATLEKDPEKQLSELQRQLDELLALNVDVLLHLERVENRAYVRLVIRAESAVASNGQTNLDSLQDRLDLIGPGWERLTGNAVREAHFGFMVGHQPPPAWKPFLLKKPEKLLAKLAESVSPKTAHSFGYAMIGKLAKPEQPFFLNASRYPSTIFEGPSGTGKSTLAAFYMLQQSADVVFVQLKSADKEGSHKWSKAFGGQVVEIDLPDVNQGEGDRTAIDLEQELFRKDSAKAQDFVRKLAEKWRTTGESWLPLAIRPKVNSLRYYNWVLAFYEALTQAWALWTVESGRTIHVVFDDMVSFPSAADSFLGQTGPQLGARARLKMREAVDTVRKDRQHIYFTVHSVEELVKDFPAGFVESCSILVRLGNDGHQMADVYDPRRFGKAESEQELLAHLQVHLPAVLVESLGRSD